MHGPGTTRGNDKSLPLESVEAKKHPVDTPSRSSSAAGQKSDAADGAPVPATLSQVTALEFELRPVEASGKLPRVSAVRKELEDSRLGLWCTSQPGWLVAGQDGSLLVSGSARTGRDSESPVTVLVHSKLRSFMQDARPSR